MINHIFQPLDIIVPFWKPIDWSSFDVVKKVRNQIKPNKVGHSGTLDPFAEGVLVLCIGKKTKESEKLMALKKEYIGTIQLGIETDTLDSTGLKINEKPIPTLDENNILSVLNEFIGDGFQIPPMYSALKKNGTPLYKLARKGIVIEREPRPIHIYDIELLSFTENKITFRVECGKGTYIRTLAKDISEKLNTCGHLINLSRTKVGNYSEIDSIQIENLNEWLSTIA
jgi:tRNA pseudouridine55 synthase